MSPYSIGGSLLVASALALLAWLVGRGKHLAAAHGLWLLVLVKLLVPPFLEAPILPSSLRPDLEPGRRAQALPPTPAPENEVVTQVVRPGVAGGSEAARTADPAGSPKTAHDAVPFTRAHPPAPEPKSAGPLAALLWIWAAGSALFAAISIVRIGRFRAAVRAARPASSATIEIARAVAAKLGSSRVPDILVLPARIPPL